MKKDLKEKWIKALKSGEYEQGKHSLRSIYDKYCCLGVLAHLVDPEGFSELKQTIGYGRVFRYLGKTSGPQFLPRNLIKELGLSQEDLSELMDMNDHQEKSFCEISNWISANILEEESA